VPAEYEFIDEWDVDAPRGAVFDALADARTYPDWWRPVYLDVQADGPPAIGCVSRQRFKGRLPYTLTQTSEIIAYDPPRSFEVKAVGDLTGHGRWTLGEPSAGRTHVRFEWRVRADKPLIRLLTPLLRGVFRANHAYAIARAIVGLGPYARAHSREGLNVASE
jgi:uncharacterized protein YndB with AHSA1/START domain